MRLTALVLLTSLLIAGLSLIVTSCGEPKYYQPFDCEIGFKLVEYRIRFNKGDYEVTAEDQAHGFFDVVYRANHESFATELVHHILPVNCRTHGGKAISLEQVEMETE